MVLPMFNVANAKLTSPEDAIFKRPPVVVAPTEPLSVVVLMTTAPPITLLELKTTPPPVPDAPETKFGERVMVVPEIVPPVPSKTMSPPRVVILPLILIFAVTAI